MNPIETAFTKYNELIYFSAYAFTGWLASWILFFIMLPFMVRFLGKVKGVSFNYAFSWVSMILIIIGLEIHSGKSEILKHFTKTT
jgi:hypothetical protein